MTAQNHQPEKLFPFARIGYISIIASWVIIFAIYVATYAIYGGYARSLDFDGGIQIEFELPAKTTVEKVRDLVKKIQPPVEAVITQYDDNNKNIFRLEAGRDVVEAIEGSDALVQQTESSFGNFIINLFGKGTLRLEGQIESKKAGAKDALVTIKSGLLTQWEGSGGNSTDLQWVSTNKVGPTVGLALRKSAVNLLLVTMLFMILYLTVRFEFRFGLGALVSLIHDLIIAWGLVGIFQIKPSIPIIAALLTLLGYSVNDTIVVFDRIRENMRGNPKISLKQIVDLSVQQSLTRTILTSLTTVISIFAMYLLGEAELKDFSFILLVGIVIGTYSSIFIAAPVVMLWEDFQNWRHRRRVVES